jgi:hypothetical protein
MWGYGERDALLKKYSATEIVPPNSWHKKVCLFADTPTTRCMVITRLYPKYVVETLTFLMNSRGIASYEVTEKARRASESLPGWWKADMHTLTLTMSSLLAGRTDE